MGGIVPFARAATMVLVGVLVLAVTPVFGAVQAMTFAPGLPIVGEYTAITGGVPAQAARSVELQRWTGTAWSKVTSATTTSAGSYRFVARAVRGHWRVLAPRTARDAAYASAAKLMEVTAQTVTITAPSSATTGSTVSVSLRAAPVRVGRAVRLERLVSGQWAVLKEGVQNSTGTATFSVPVTVGTWHLRAKVLARSGASEAVSRAVAIDVAPSPEPESDYPDAKGPIARLTDTDPAAAYETKYATGPGNSISTNGRWYVFSTAAVVVPGDDNAASDVFVYDRATGVIRMISRKSDGSVGRGHSRSPTISGDGRWIAFVGPAYLLGERNDHEFTTYVWDRVYDRLRQVSPLNASDIISASISLDGTHVAYVGASASSITVDDGGAVDTNVYLWNRLTGVQTLVTADHAGMPIRDRAFGNPRPADGGAFVVYEAPNPNDYSVLRRWRASDRSNELISARAGDGGHPHGPVIGGSMSADGNRVVYYDMTDEIVAGDIEGTADALLWEAGKGTRMLNRDPATPSDSGPSSPLISADGHYVAYTTGPNDGPRKLVRVDLSSGEQVELAGDPAHSWSASAALSPDGRRIMLSSRDALVTEDTNERADLYVGDFAWGAVPTTGSGFTDPHAVAPDGWARPALPAPTAHTLVSARPDGTSGGGYYPTVSSGGRFVAFSAQASLVDPNTSDETYQVYVRDTTTGTLKRVTDGMDGSGANQSVHYPEISRDGRWVLYDTGASNLTTGDLDFAVNNDLFLTDRTTGATTMVTRATWADGHSRHNPLRGALSPNGRYVAYWSDFSLDRDDPLPWAHSRLHLYDRTTGKTVRFERARDSQGHTDPYGWGTWPVSVADDGTVAFARREASIEGVNWSGTSTSTRVYLWHGATDGSLQRIGTQSGPAWNEGIDEVGPQISANGAAVVFTSRMGGAGDTNGVPDVYRWDRATRATVLVSKGPRRIGDHWSTTPSVSDDGSVVAFVSLASNLDGWDSNRFADAYVWKAADRSVKRVSLRHGQSPNRGTFRLSVSPDGGRVAIETSAWIEVPDSVFPQRRDVYLVTLP